MGMDGAALSAFFLGIPANEIVLPITLMSYLGAGEMVSIENASLIGEILKNNGWTHISATCYIIFSVVHFPCATALLTIHKETKSLKLTLLAFAMPTVLGIALCGLVNIIENI
jgi:ferrous iron transport protein B